MLKKLDSYLFREFAQATFATLVVLMIVSLGGVFADVLGDIARGRVPAGMMLAQLGLQLLNYLPLILPLGLMLGLLLAIGRLYRDSEMPVLTAIGVGPRRLLRPLMMLVLPVVAVIALCSLWLGPGARGGGGVCAGAGGRRAWCWPRWAGSCSTTGRGSCRWGGCWACCWRSGGCTATRRCRCSPPSASARGACCGR